MKLAVLIPCYNAERYLKDCLDSVFAAACRFVERSQGTGAVVVLCGLDGATDSTGRVLDDYRAEHGSEVCGVTMQVVKHGNIGVSATRNDLLDRLPGDVDAVAFVDADDLVSPIMLTALAESLEREGADVAECLITHNGTELFNGEADSIRRVVSENMQSGCWINVVNKLYRKSVVEQVRFRAGLSFEEDNFFNREVNRVAKRKVTLVAAMYYYRDNPSSATGQLDMERYLASVTERVRLTLEIFGPSAELAKDAYRMMVRKNLKKNRDGKSRRRLFLAAGSSLRRLVTEGGLNFGGLNPVQKLLVRCCLGGHYHIARLVALFT